TPTISASGRGCCCTADAVVESMGASLSDAAGHIIVGFAAGGGTDPLARLIGRWLSERLGQQFIVEKRTGANGNIGTEAVVRSPPDGYKYFSQCGRADPRRLANAKPLEPRG